MGRVWGEIKGMGISSRELDWDGRPETLPYFLRESVKGFDSDQDYGAYLVNSAASVIETLLNDYSKK